MVTAKEEEEGDGERKIDNRGQNVISSLHFIAAFYAKHASVVSKTASSSRKRATVRL